MENLAFQLSLVDAVGAPAKKAADALKRVEDNAKKAQKALNFGKEHERAEFNLKKIQADPKGYEKLIRAQKELSEQRKKIAKQSGIGGESLSESLNKKLGFGKLATAAFAGDVLAEGAMKVGETIIEAAHKVVEIFTEGFKKAIEEGSKLQVLRLGYKLSLGKEGGKESLEDVSRFSKQTGFDDDAIAQMMLPMRRAGFSQKAARSNMALAMDAAAGLGKGGDEGTVSGILGGLTDIKHRGGITKKQLNSFSISDQNVPDFYKALGKELKVSAKKAEEMAAEGGKVDPQLIINMLGKSLEKQQGGQLGTGAEAYGKTLEARLKKLQNLPNEYLKTIADSPAFTKLADKVGIILEKLNPESATGQRIVGKIQAMFESIVGWIDEMTTDEGMDKLANGITTAVSALQTAVDVTIKLAHWLEKVFDVASKVASPLASAMEIGDKLLGRSDGGGGTAAPGNDDDFRERLRKAVTSGALPADQVAPLVARHKAGLSVNIPQINVTVHSAQGEDPSHTGQVIAFEIGKHLINHVERAAQE